MFFLWTSEGSGRTCRSCYWDDYVLMLEGIQEENTQDYMLKKD